LKFDRKMRREFTFNGTYDTWLQLKLNNKRKMNTWFVYWYATLFLRGGLALYSGKSLVQNIGMDGSGVHCGASNYYDMEPAISAIQIAPIPLSESKEAVTRHEYYFRNQFRTPLHLRIVRKLRREFGRLVRGIRPDGTEKR
jgi:hypothetical protein